MQIIQAGRFQLQNTSLQGVQLVMRQALGDQRGWLERLYCFDDFKSLGLTKPIAQINRTLTEKKGSVRGVHFQREPFLETKIVSCLKGRVWDVAVDLRLDSPTYLQWFGQELSAQNRYSLYIPEGFAHGFQTLEDACELQYLHTQAFVPSADAGIHPLDPRLNIAWPLPVGQMSDKDKNRAFIDSEFVGLKV